MARILLPLALSSLVASPAFADPPSFLSSPAEDLPGVVDSAPAMGARAPATSVAVMALTGAAGVGISELQEAAQRAIEKRTALKVTTLDPEQDKRVRKCAGDPSCFKNELRASGSNADLLLTVSVSSLKEDDSEDAREQVLLGLLLVDARNDSELAGRERIKTGELAEELQEGVSPNRVLEDYIEKVFPRSIWGEIASIKVDANEENAEVEIRGAGIPSCVTPCTIDRVFPGQYQVMITKQGFKPWTGAVDLKTGQLGKVKATLEEEDSSIIASPWFWGGIGAAVAAGAVTAVVLAQSSEGPTTICIAQSEDQCQ